jgi:hypothetical protein
LKKNRNRVKPTGFGSVWFGFLGQKPVQTSLDRFWLGFSGLARFFSGFLSVLVRFGSVRFFQFFVYKTETEPACFFKNLIGLIVFFRFGFFGYFFLVFLV